MGKTLWQYYKDLAARISDTALADVATLPDWQKQREDIRRKFFISMGLEPFFEKCDLRVTDYGEFGGEGYRARKIAYQILPDCWATANVYFPDPLPEGKLPAVHYSCGHTHIGVWGYQNHAVMWARRGYVCFIFDTIEQHDNPGEHHGLYYKDRYDWISMGYTAAGGELWNGIRALDAMETIEEIDPERIGATGNSGGGAGSFYVAIADERVKAVATSCGVATPKYTIAHRNMMGHCDCMYLHNPFQLDTTAFAALIAPRPLLFCFARHDSLFNPAEFREAAQGTRKVYDLYGCGDRCDLCEYDGPHGYQPESIDAINTWFDMHVAGDPRPLLQRDDPEHDESVTTVFDGVPPMPDRLDLLPELLSQPGAVRLPRSPEDWSGICEEATQNVRGKVFHLLDGVRPVELEQVGDWQGGADPANRRESYRAQIEGMDVWIDAVFKREHVGKVVIAVANAEQCARDALAQASGNGAGATIAVEPRGTGFTACTDQDYHLLRAGALTGVTPAALLVHDLHALMPAILELPYVKDRSVYLYGCGDAGIACLYHALFNKEIAGVIAENLPASHHGGGYINGILRVVDLPQAIGLVAPRPIGLVNMGSTCAMHWARRVYDRLGIPGKLVRTGSRKGAFDAVTRER
ncbi:MAG: hypothetical protein HN742_29430 [Lentisphaerae bacterium]|jgi:dienelactone hydrolase|nr:hypothetical protein [Lentisphaerota bacterium]MBT4814870.1 hypothetical protein [Lentisphaerota bacterium]MBT5609019.1 hypothetical protein [Lentisphaerota bacterium]MBT7055451.1 hypothetical protein [Lentisphaerota bacterium]MBT7846030.1 hypothetical protein [Lentisphaerota bacterium]